MPGIDLSSLFPDASATAASLSAIYATLSGAPAAGKSPPADALAALSNAELNQKADIAATAKQPQVQRDIAAFTKAVASAKTPADLLANPIARKVLLTANGLADQIAYPALATKALLSDPSVTKSLTNRLSSVTPAYLATAKTYQFATKGLSVISNPKVQATITQAYAEVTWRQSLDASTPGLSSALTFRAAAAGIRSTDDILGDKILRDVVITALGIPKQIAFQSLGAQERAISDRLDLSQFQNKKFVEAFTQRYLIAVGQAAGTSSVTPDLGALSVRAQGLLA